MPVTCQLKASEGLNFCATECPTEAEGGVFQYVRVEKADQVPERADQVIDVAVLDMHHGFPNLGHDCIVNDLLDAVCDLQPALTQRGLFVRVLSYDVRRGLVVPDAGDGRFELFVGTGGPGHLDPRKNDGVSPWSQGVKENPAWEDPFMKLLDAVNSDQDTAFLAICHSFGLLCRWAGVATPSFRGSEKGGKSAGLLENWLTEDGVAHPWFRRFAAELKDGRRHRVVDSRLFDLLATPAAPARSILAVEDAGGRPGDAVTMMELARDGGGVMPRILGTNHHPEIVDRERQRQVLEHKFKRGEVSAEWYQERRRALAAVYADEDSDRRSHLTSDFTLLLPLRFYLTRAVRRRAQHLGDPIDIHENSVVDQGVASTVV